MKFCCTFKFRKSCFGSGSLQGGFLHRFCWKELGQLAVQWRHLLQKACRSIIVKGEGPQLNQLYRNRSLLLPYTEYIQYTKSTVTQSCPTLCDPMDCRPPGSSVQGIFQARILEWVAISYFRGIFPTQGSKPHLQGHRHLQADSLPAEPQNILKVLNIQYAEGKWGRDEEDSNH